MFKKSIMFALRQSSLMLRNVWAMRPSMSIAARRFADSTEPAKAEPQEKGDPEVIAFINKVGDRYDWLGSRLCMRTR